MNKPIGEGNMQVGDTVELHIKGRAYKAQIVSVLWLLVPNVRSGQQQKYTLYGVKPRNTATNVNKHALKRTPLNYRTLPQR